MIKEERLTARQINESVMQHLFGEEWKDMQDLTFEENGKVGLKSCKGKLLVPAIFDEIPERYASEQANYNTAKEPDSCIPVVKEGKYALAKMDGKGTLLTPFKYDGIFRYFGHEQPCFICEQGKKKGVLNHQGEELVKCEMDEIFDLVEDHVLFVKDGKWGFMYYQEWIEPIYDEIQIQLDEYVKMRMGDQWGWLDSNGRFTSYAGNAYYFCETWIERKMKEAAAEKSEMYALPFNPPERPNRDINCKVSWKRMKKEIYKYCCGLRGDDKELQLNVFELNEENIIPELMPVWKTFEKHGFYLNKLMAAKGYEEIEDEVIRKEVLMKICFPLIDQPISRFMMDWLNGYLDFFKRYPDCDDNLTDEDILYALFYCQSDRDIWRLMATNGIGDVRSLYLWYNAKNPNPIFAKETGIPCHCKKNKWNAMSMLRYLRDDDPYIKESIKVESYKLHEYNMFS